jgi:tagatose-1,6-bisphosphate aldolase
MEILISFRGIIKMVEQKKVSKEQQIGIHKGALSVLAIEQQEFLKILQVVQQQIESHVKALKGLGVDLEAEAKKVQEQQNAVSKSSTGDDLLDRLG